MPCSILLFIPIYEPQLLLLLAPTSSCSSTLAILLLDSRYPAPRLSLSCSSTLAILLLDSRYPAPRLSLSCSSTLAILLLESAATSSNDLCRQIHCVHCRWWCMTLEESSRTECQNRGIGQLRLHTVIQELNKNNQSLLESQKKR